MIRKDSFTYRGERYSLVLSEERQIYKPDAAGVGNYYGEYTVDGYDLVIKRLCLCLNGKAVPEIEGSKPTEQFTEDGKEYAGYQNLMESVAYTGGIVIARDFVYGFGLNEEEYPCFCYRDVVEFLFQDGKLVTTVDHSKAMVRIRKNLKLGLRDLKKGKDARCIRIFLKKSLIGRYRDSFLKKSMKLAKRKVAAFVSG